MKREEEREKEEEESRETKERDQLNYEVERSALKDIKFYYYPLKLDRFIPSDPVLPL